MTDQSDTHADHILWQEGVPVSARFDDPYYSREHGLAESIHTFLHGCGLPAAWRGTDHFTVAETGFGTGLNFLATLQAFKQDPAAPRRLTYISVEGYPLTAADVAKAHRLFPDVAAESAELLAVLPPPEPGIHRRTLQEGKVTLVLLLGDAATMLARLNAQVDAWFLDGFAPARNPDMWAPDVLRHIARTSHSGTRLASFTAAGFVRRGLADLGLSVEKAPGFGRKRERLVAYGPQTKPKAAAPAGAPVAIIGGGIAGLALARRLTADGRAVTVFDAAGETAGSRTPVPIIAPRLHLNRQQAGPAFIAHAYARAVSYGPYQRHIIGDRGAYMRAGGTANADRLARMAEAYPWGEDWIKTLPDDVFFPKSIALDGRALLADMARAIKVTAETISHIARNGDGWLLTTAGGQHHHHTGDLVLACGAGRWPEGAPDLALRHVPGHTAFFDAASFGALADHSHIGDRYITPTHPERQARLIGATVEKFRPLADPAADLVSNSAALHGADDMAAQSLWYGIRATTADHLPLVGPWPRQLGAGVSDWLAGEAGAPSGLWIFSGFGSKGFQYVPHAADLLAEQMADYPVMARQQQDLPLAPIRFLARAHKRTPGRKDQT